MAIWLLSASALVVFLGGVFCGVMLRQSSDSANQNLAWALFGTALVFNPFLPVYLPREVWAVLDLAAAGIFGYTPYRQKRGSEQPATGEGSIIDANEM